MILLECGFAESASVFWIFTIEISMFMAHDAMGILRGWQVKIYRDLRKQVRGQGG